MKKFTVYSNWGYIDQLDGLDIKNGEFVRIQFPDGTVQKAQLYVQKDRFVYSDMGHKSSGPDHKAYFDFVVHGLPISVYVRGTKLKAERLTQ